MVTTLSMNTWMQKIGDTGELQYRALCHLLVKSIFSDILHQRIFKIDGSVDTSHCRARHSKIIG